MKRFTISIPVTIQCSEDGSFDSEAIVRLEVEAYSKSEALSSFRRTLEQVVDGAKRDGRGRVQ